MTKRARIYRQMDPIAWDRPGLSAVNWTTLTLVLISVIVAIVQSERTIRDVIPDIFDGLQLRGHLNLIQPIFPKLKAMSDKRYCR